MNESITKHGADFSVHVASSDSLPPRFLAASNGCRPSQPLAFTAPVPQGRALCKSFDVADASLSWSKYCVPAQMQHGGSCGANATMNAFEVLLRRSAPAARVAAMVTRKLGAFGPWQLDGDTLYKQACRRYHGNDKDEGLLMSEIAQLGELSGIMAGEPVFRVTGASESDELICDALAHGPIVCGRALCDNDSTPEKNGYVAPQLPNPQAGHAQAFVAYHWQGGSLYYVTQQTWGRRFGWQGYVVYGAEFMRYALFNNPQDAPIQWRPEPGWVDRHEAALMKYIVADTEGGLQ